MKHILYISLACFVLGITACRKYVEIPALNVKELKNTKDYQALLNNGSGLIEKAYYYPVWSSDDAGSDNLTWQNAQIPVNGYAYTWAPKFYSDLEDDRDWADMYKTMYTLNSIITDVMQSEGGTEAEKRNAYTQAQVHRAFLYLTLVNIYAKQYDSATAATDPGVPVLLNSSLFSSLKRWPVADVYGQILKDLQEALPNLPDQPDNVTYPAKGAAYAILAKTYLDMRAFSNAKLYADSALQLKSTLIDLNAYITNVTSFPHKINDPEIILSKVTDQIPLSVPLSTELVTLLGTKDLRYQVYTKDGVSIPPANYTNRGYMKHRILNEGTFVGPGVPEMMLIKAECEARAGNASVAVSILNTLRKKRFTPTDYADLTATTGADALKLVIDERRRELMGTGARWFDQRRLQLDAGANFIRPVTRIFKGVTYTLPLGSNLYVYAIGDKYIKLNPEIEQNPR
jgi:hypothetical protein